jgi:hypothetical protein
VGPRRVGHSKAYFSIILKQIMVSVGYRYEIYKYLLFLFVSKSIF